MFQAMGAAQGKAGRQEIERVVLAELHLCEVQVTQSNSISKKQWKKGRKHGFGPHCPLLTYCGCIILSSSTPVCSMCETGEK